MDMLIVRNGHLPEREVVSGVAPIRVSQPLVRHRDKGRFTSAILPKYMRRAPSVAILGDGASGLNVRLDEERTRVLVLIGAIRNGDHLIFCHWRILSFWRPRLRPRRFVFLPKGCASFTSSSTKFGYTSADDQK
jgi:hypothetical protein